jgi:hypothetical protein
MWSGGLLPTAPEIIIKTALTHTVTYFIAGVTAYTLLDYPSLLAETALGLSFRSLRDPIVIAGPALQPIRGLLFGFVFYVLKEPFFGLKKGWLAMWLVLGSIGILGTFAAPPGSIEGVIYTELPISLHLTMLPEILAQSFLLSWLRAKTAHSRRCGRCTFATARKRGSVGGRQRRRSG